MNRLTPILLTISALLIGGCRTLDKSTNSISEFKLLKSVSEFDKYKSKYTAVSSSSSNRWNYRVSAFGNKLLVGIKCTPFDEETFQFNWEGKTISFRVNEGRELNPRMGDYGASITNRYLEIIPGGNCKYVKFNFPKSLTSVLHKMKGPGIASINKSGSSRLSFAADYLEETRHLHVIEDPSKGTFDRKTLTYHASHLGSGRRIHLGMFRTGAVYNSENKNYYKNIFPLKAGKKFKYKFSGNQRWFEFNAQVKKEYIKIDPVLGKIYCFRIKGVIGNVNANWERDISTVICPVYGMSARLLSKNYNIVLRDISAIREKFSKSNSLPLKVVFKGIGPERLVNSIKTHQEAKSLHPYHKRLAVERGPLFEKRRRKEKERQRQIAEDESVQRWVVERKKEYQKKRRLAEVQRRQKQGRLAMERKRKKERELSKRLAAERRRLAAERKKEKELRAAKVRLREAEDNSRAKREQVASTQKTLLRELTKLKEEVSRLKKRQNRTSKEDIPENTWRSSGSGFYLKGSTHVMTNYHVVRKAKFIQVSFPKRRRYRGRVIAIDKNNDLAVVKLLKMRARRSGFGFRYGTRVRVGEEVHALGYPLGASLSRNPSMVSGRISSATGMEDSLSQFRMTAPINAGNSGGPIVNDKGELVGISKGGHVQRGVEGVRFGIRVSAAGMILEQIPASTNFDVRVRARKRKRSPSQIFSELSPYVVMIEVK